MRAALRQVKRGLVDLYWMFRGPRIRMPAIPANPRSVLFVCKGNICRSPFAERIAQRIASERGLDQLVFGSAGIHVSSPVSSPEEAVRAAERFGVDLGPHRSQPISAQLCKPWDMIIVMEVWQLDTLQKPELGVRDRVFLLAVMEDLMTPKATGWSAVNIEDPYGGPTSAFDKCFVRIQRSVSRLIDRLEVLE